MKKTLSLISLTLSLLLTLPLLALSPQARELGFVEVSTIDPTIIVSLRYATPENFVGAPVNGYKKPVLLLTRQAAQALKKAHDRVKKDGYRIVVYDGYRPQDAVNHFMIWSTNLTDQSKKSQYYPRVDKARVFELGYVAEKSGHSRGSTVDLTLIKEGDTLHPIEQKKRTLLDGFTITLLDDGTVDMGSSFDLFDVASHHENNVIPEEYKALRSYLRRIMEECGFKTISEEWWHYTLKNEPYPADKDSSYFNFPVE